MRSLFPEASDRVNLVEVYSRGLKVPQGRPFVRVNMIATLDGATNFAGRSGGLGGPGTSCSSQCSGRWRTPYLSVPAPSGPRTMGRPGCPSRYSRCARDEASARYPPSSW